MLKVKQEQLDEPARRVGRGVVWPGAASLLMAALWLWNTESLLDAVSMILGGVAAWLCFRRSGCYQSHVRWGWRLLAGGALGHCAWAVSKALQSERWAGSGNLAFPLGLWEELSLSSLTIAFYLAGLLWREHGHSAQITPRRRIDLCLSMFSLLLTVGWLFPAAQATSHADPGNRWLFPCAVFMVAGGAVAGLIGSGKRAADLGTPETWKWLVTAAVANAARHTLIAGGSQGLWAEPPWLAALARLFELASLLALGLGAAGARRAESPEPPSHQGAEDAGNFAVPLIASLCLAGAILFGFPSSLSPGPDAGQGGWNRLPPALIFLVYAGLMLMRLKAGESGALRNAEESQRQAAYLRVLLDNINEAVVTEDLSGRIQFANQAFYRLFSLRTGKLESLRVKELIHPNDRRKWRIRHRKRDRPESWAKRFKCRGFRTDGARIELAVSLSPLSSGGILMGRQSVIRDITRVSLIEKSQRAMAQRLEFFVSNMPLGCIIWDPGLAVQEWNKSAERIFGWTHAEVLNRQYCDFLAPREDRGEMEELWKGLLQGKAARNRQCENLTKLRGRIECEWFHTSLLDDSGRVVAVASMVQDVSDRRSLERQLLQSQKLEAVGTLAGGIAHDFNNLLTAMLGRITLARMKLGPSHEISSDLGDAERAGERAAELVQQLLGFSRKTRAELKTVDVAGCIREVVGLFEHSLDRRIKMEVDLASNLWQVEGDRGHLEQVLMNLLVNARDAIPGSGRIRVGAVNRTLEQRNRNSGAHLRSGEFVAISVIDDGHGMDRSTQSRIFEPFFTTKEVGKGTGLGLAMVYAIVEGHRGWIEVSSRPGGGSTFRVYLPRTQRQIEADPPRAEHAPRRGVETILLADDEDLVRGLGREILESQGHPVLEARDGQEAVEIFEQNQARIGLVILDLTMPRKSGWEAFEDIHRLNPDVPVVMASGYSVEGGPEWAREKGARAFLPKPFNPSGLLAVVQGVLDGSR